MAFTRYYPASSHIYDPAVAPTKPIQHIVAQDNSKWNGEPKSRFDTTYRTEFIGRNNQNGDQYTKPTVHFKKALNQYPVLPPISSSGNRNDNSDQRSVVSESGQGGGYYDQEVPMNENTMPSNFNDQQQQQQYYQPEPPMMSQPEDTYLPQEPVLLTDFEEQRLAGQIRDQLGASAAVERLKLLYQELATYDPNRTNFVHYSQIQMLMHQLGLHLGDDTLRFAMCKFVSPDRTRGFVNYEDLVRFFGKCLSGTYPNPYVNQQQQQQQNTPQRTMRPSMDDEEKFDPDERQIRVLLKQNLKNFDLNGTIDFDRLTRELSNVDRNQSGVLNRQQIEEVVYKVRIPFQRSLIYQILEKHCRAYSTLYNWQSFVQYLKDQIFDLKEMRDRSSPIYSQYVPSRSQWLDDMQREFHEKDRLRVIDRYVSNSPGVRLEGTHPYAWFTRFLRLANAMYSHRKNSNVSQEFVLPREEARRLFRAYNHVWNLELQENQMQRVFDMCSRNGHVVVDDALKQLAK